MKRFFFLLFLGIIFHCLFISATVAYGDSRNSLDEEINYWRAQNQELEGEIATLTSYEKIMQRAGQAGLWHQTADLRADVDFSVALKR